jgi:uncharacterized protein YegJ (DUF2314 family)
MKEDEEGNVIGVCVGCTEKRKLDWQKENKDLKMNVGDYVKASFKVGSAVEHMWVRISRISSHGVISGKLSNEAIIPAIARRYKPGKEVDLKFSDIEDYLPKAAMDEG